MKNSFDKEKSCYVRKTVPFFAILFCLQFYMHGAKAQGSIDGKFLSKRPQISQIFYPTKNETEVKVILASNADVSDPNMLTNDQIIVPIQSGVNLGFATYIYEGRVPGEKRGVRFTVPSR